MNNSLQDQVREQNVTLGELEKSDIAIRENINQIQARFAEFKLEIQAENRRWERETIYRKQWEKEQAKFSNYYKDQVSFRRLYDYSSYPFMISVSFWKYSCCVDPQN